jgi:general nucleoside transport system permease protein
MRRMIAIATLCSALMLALAILSLALALLGHHPGTILLALLTGAFGSWYALSETLLRTVPVLLCALAATIPAEGGQINIGGEGQFHLGAIGAVLLVMFWGGGNSVALSYGMVLAAIICGGLWAAIPGALRAFLGINEALVSLFLNYVAIYFLQFLVHGPMRDPLSQGWPMSPKLPDSLLLKSVGEGRLHSGIFVAFALTLILIAVIRFTRRGTELRAVGANAKASATIGIPVSSYLFGSMVVGGMLAGLAGYYEIAAVQGRLRTDISLGFGYSGFLVAWMCRGQLLLILPVAVLVAGLIASSQNLQIVAGLPAASADVIQGALLLFVVLSRPLLAWFERRRAIRHVIEGGGS